MTIQDVLQSLQDAAHKSHLYKQLLLGNHSDLKYHDIPSFQNYRSFLLEGVTFTANSNKPLEPNYYSVKAYPSNQVHTFYNVQLPQEASDPWSAFIFKDHCFCQLTDGSYCLISILNIHDRDDILAVFTIPVPNTKSLCLRWETSHEMIEGVGVFENCANLRYIAPIPEGITDMTSAFSGCVSLNCPLFLPSTLRWCKDLLQDCTNFSSNIYAHGKSAVSLGIPEWSANLISD